MTILRRRRNNNTTPRSPVSEDPQECQAVAERAMAIIEGWVASNAGLQNNILQGKEVELSSLPSAARRAIAAYSGEINGHTYDHFDAQAYPENRREYLKLQRFNEALLHLADNFIEKSNATAADNQIQLRPEQAYTQWVKVFSKVADVEWAAVSGENENERATVHFILKDRDRDSLERDANDIALLLNEALSGKKTGSYAQVLAKNDETVVVSVSNVGAYEKRTIQWLPEALALKQIASMPEGGERTTALAQATHILARQLMDNEVTDVDTSLFPADVTDSMHKANTLFHEILSHHKIDDGRQYTYMQTRAFQGAENAMAAEAERKGLFADAGNFAMHPDPDERPAILQGVDLRKPSNLKPDGVAVVMPSDNFERAIDVEKEALVGAAKDVVSVQNVIKAMVLMGIADGTRLASTGVATQDIKSTAIDTGVGLGVAAVVAAAVAVRKTLPETIKNVRVYHHEVVGSRTHLERKDAASILFDTAVKQALAEYKGQSASAAR